MNVVGLWWKSRAEIEDAHARAHATTFRDSRLTAEVGAVTFVRSDVAVMRLTWDLTGQKKTNGSTGQPRKGILTFVLTPEADHWVIRAAQNTDIVSRVVAPPTRG